MGMMPSNFVYALGKLSLADWVGLVGGLVGIGSAGISYATYRRDQAHLRIWLGDYQIMAGEAGDDMARTALAAYRERGETPPPELYYRDPDVTWLTIDIANIGRRPIKVEKVGVVVERRDGPFSTFADFKPCVLAEGENATQRVDKGNLGDVRVLAAFACDGARRTRYGGFIGGWRGWICRAKAWLGIRPFAR